jgi:hypothetical protein
VHHRGDWVRQQPEFIALTQQLKRAVSVEQVTESSPNAGPSVLTS